jgi:YegS/Rv2252/BmrU family lipid kinase
VRVTVIVNPVSGFGANPRRVGRRVEEAARVLEAAGVRPEVLVTARPGHAAELVRGAVARGAERIIAWGGDGTVNEVGSALVDGSVPLGIVAGGSGNGLARALHLPRRPVDALRHAVRAPLRRIDAGEIDGRLFFNVAGVGFDAHVAHAFSRRVHPRGLRSYVAVVARELWAYVPRPVTVRLDGVTSEHRALLLTIANGPQWGSGALIAPAASIDDGLFDVVSVEPRSVLQAAMQIPRLFTGSIASAPGVTIRRARRVVVTGTPPLVYHADGEALVSESAVLEARMRPGALTVCAGGGDAGGSRP